MRAAASKIPASWTADQYVQAKALWRQGESGAVIGAAIGQSRSAVVSLAFRNRSDFPARKIQGQNRRRCVQPRHFGHVDGQREAPYRRPASLSVELDGLARRAADLKTVGTLLELTPHQCRFPLGDITGAEMRCCGRKIDSAAVGWLRSYCKDHGAIAKRQRRAG